MLTFQNENAGLQSGAGQNKNLCDAIIKSTTVDVNNIPLPLPETVKGRCLGALLNGERITHLDCWKRFGSARLSHHIYILRGMGWPVQMIEQTVTTSDAGRAATIGVYFLAPEVIAEAGERGREYAIECAQVELERRAA